MKIKIFKKCQDVFPEWRKLAVEDFDFDDPKGFSSFTMGIRCKKNVSPPAVLYRQLEGKENAILDFEEEKEIFNLLGGHNIAAPCLYYDNKCRIETFYFGRTLTSQDLLDHNNLLGIANQLFNFHSIVPERLPSKSFFQMLHEQWGKLAQHVLNDKNHLFPENEQKLCTELKEIYAPATLDKVMRCIPDGPLSFCHNDTYHGNIMKLDNGEIKLLDFEFSCLNYKVYDFSNLWAETVMQHKQSEYPYFKVGETKYSDNDIGTLINYYLDNKDHRSEKDRIVEFNRLLCDTKNMLLLSDFKYSMAALPLAVDPIQKIRFIPYAHTRFKRFLSGYKELQLD